MKTENHGRYLFVLTLLLSIFYLPLCVGTHAYFDAQAWAWLGYGSAADGIPWFNPLEGIGVPLAAAGTLGWNPIHYLCTRILSQEAAYSLVILLHIVLFGWTAYWYALSTRLRKTAAFYVAAILSMGGVLVGANFDLAKLLVFSYYPLSLIVMRYMVVRPRVEYIFYLGVIFALQFVAGDVGLAMLAWLASAIVYTLDCYKRRQLKLKPAVRRFVLSVLVGLLFALPQILFYMAHADLSAVDLWAQTFDFGEAFNLAALINFWLPCFEALFSAPTLYIGGAASFFIFCAIASRHRDSLVKLHLFMTLISFLISLGFISFNGQVGSMIFFASFSAAWLSARGLQNLFDEGLLDRKFAIRASNMHFWFSATVLCITVSFLFLIRLGHDALRSAILMVLQGQVASSVSRPADYYQQRVDAWLSDLDKIMSFGNSWFVYALFSLLLFSVVVFIMRKRPKKGLLYAGIVVLTLLDLGVYRLMWNRDYLQSFAAIKKNEAVLNNAASENDLMRRLVFASDYADVQAWRFSGRATLNSNSPTAAKSFVELFDGLGVVNFAAEDVGLVDEQTLAKFRPLLNFATVGYFVGLGDVQPAGTKRMDKSGGVGVYQNKRVMMRAALIETFAVLPAAEQLKMLREAELSLDEVVLLSKLPKRSPHFSYELVEGAKDGVAIRHYSSTEIVIDVVSAREQVLTLADQYYPGWEAFIDGKPVEVLRANYAFRAILMPPGPHRVEFKYQPTNVIGSVLDL